MQTLFLGSTFETWIVVIAVSMLATLVVISDHRKETAGIRSPPTSNQALSPNMRRLVVIAAILAIFFLSLLWRLVSQSDADVNILSVGVDAVAHWGLFSSLLLWAVLPRRGHFVMLGLGLVVLLSGVAAGGTSRSMAAQTSIALAACVGFSIASQIIMGTSRGAGVRASANDNSQDERTRWMVRTVSLTTMSLILMTTGVVASTTNRLLPGLQLAVQEQLHDSLEVVVDRTGFGGTRYVKSGKLGSVRDHITFNPKEVALVVESRFAPGYLRGRVYDKYQQQRWFASTRLNAALTGSRASIGRVLRPASVGTTNVHLPRARKLNRFVLSPAGETAPDSATIADLIIYNNPVKGYVIFAPLATMWIEASSDELMINEHAEIGLGIDVTKPYVAGVGLRPPRESLTPEQRKVLTEVPEAMKSQAARVAATVFPKVGTVQTKAAAVSRYFQSQGDYSLQPPMSPAGIDPIAFFLRERHPAHCEYFASATVALLRSAGIPSRYVTGYVVNELEESSTEIWLARNQNAHAWVEAYDDQTQRWFGVELTPGRTYQTVTLTADTLAGNIAAGALSGNSDGSSDTLLGRIWGFMLTIRATDALVLVFQFAQLPLFLFLVSFWWVKFRRKGASSSDALDSISLKMLRKADRKIRKHALSRRPSETLFQFADRIESTLDGSIVPLEIAERRRLADWYRQYASARYRGQMPEPLRQTSS